MSALTIALGAVFVGASTVATIGTGQDALAIAVRLHVDSSITSHRISSDLKEEAATIWRPYGVQLQWMDADAPVVAAPAVAVDAWVERDRTPRNPTEWSAVLGRVGLKPQTEEWRKIRVSFDATARALTQWRTGGSSMNALALDGELGRALGRVLAHEIGHVLLGPPHHDRTGLMRAVLPANELSEPDRRPFRLDASGVGRLRARVRALSAPTVAAPHRTR
jgi:hypothetical protein